jgi:endonuclease/exonuclease/phosphatase family metal-dependent hydrolase
MTVDFDKSDSTAAQRLYSWHGFVSQPTYRVIEYFKRWGNPLDPAVFDNCSTKVRELGYRLIGPTALAGAATLLFKRASLPQLGLLAAGLFVAGVGRNILHHLAAFKQEKNYIHVRTPVEEVETQTPKILSWNILGFPAGMNYTCGGCIPFRHRLSGIANKINAEKPDIGIFQECFMDASITDQITEKFKDKYAHFFTHNGPNQMGLESGLLVMSKSPISDYTFTPFTTNEWQMTRGFVTLKIPAHAGRPAFAIIGTHMESGSDPVDADKRKAQLAQIHAHAKSLTDIDTVFLAGDLNIDTVRDTSSIGLDEVLDGVWRFPTCTNRLNKIRYPDSKAHPEEYIDQLGTIIRETDSDLTLTDRRALVTYETEGQMDYRNALSDHRALVATVQLKV